MSRSILSRLRQCSSLINARGLLVRRNPSVCLSSSAFMDSQQQLNPLYISYAKIKEGKASSAHQSALSAESRSPLLSHLDVLQQDNTLKSIDWNDWSFLRDLFNKTNFYYIKDFCESFGYDHANNPIISQDFVKRTSYMLAKTNIGGKNNRGLLHCASLLYLRKHQQKEITARDVHNAFTLALAMEALQSFFLVMDDVMDQSITRRGQPCWYRYENVGLKAVNDGPIIEQWVFWLINHRLMLQEDESLVLKERLNELFREVNILTMCGQSIDLELVKDADKMREVYTLERYETIAMYKASFYTFYLPYAAALYLAGFDDRDENGGLLRKQLNLDSSQENVIDDGFLFHIVRQMSIDMGIQFQIDDDYLDCFGDPAVTGKEGTDIQDFKCSWIAVKALQMMNEQQYELLKKHYGKNDPTDVKMVKKLYDEVGVENAYKEWQEQEQKKMKSMVEQCDGILPKEMFTLILDKLYKRKA